MSSDTAKEIASVVDSSVTDWKQEIGNSDDPESSSFKVHEHQDRTDERGHSHGQMGSTRVKMLSYDTRYFIIKSLSHQNIQLSIEKGIWATQIMNEPILEEAFRNSGKVILIFSVNMSGFFQGYAQMMSSVGWRRDNVWSQGSGKSNPWGRSFKVKWLRLNDLPFQKTLHLKNPLNDCKPVKISRDCQELSPDIGEALCDLLDGNSNVGGLLKSFPRDEVSSKGPCLKKSYSIGDEKYNMPPVHVSLSSSRPLLYPSLLYQHQAEVNRFHSAQQRSAGTPFPEILPIDSGESKVAGTKHSHLGGQVPNLRGDRDVDSEFDVWDLSAESPRASTMTEDDFLDMSYEEYVEVHSRCNKQFYLPVTAPSGMLESSRSRKRDNDRYSSFVTDHSSGHKRTHHSSSPKK